MKDSMTSITTGSLRVEIDGQNGRVTAVRNLARDLDLLSLPATPPPFRVELKEEGVVDTFNEFVCEPLANGLRLIWELPQHITLSSDVLVRGDDILFTVAAANRGQATIDRIEYPILGGIGRLGGAGEDELVHTHASGMLFHDPLDLFAPDPENGRRLRYSPYPEGFAGSTMQFVAYYARGRGGFFLGTEDGAKSVKWYSFYKEGDALCSSTLHKAARPRPGAGLIPSYAVVVSALTQGNWYEAGDRYRSWAWSQAWAQPGPRSRWLRENVGVCTFGVNARYDRSAWFDAFHRMAGTPVFHVLGPNWARYGHDYHNNLPRGREDWFPAVFHEANLATIRGNGDYWAPFEFDLLCAHNPDFSDPVLESRMVHNYEELGLSDPNLIGFPFMCAGTDYWHDFHVERDARLVAEHDPHALYYDISVSNLLMQCLATNHRHEPGAGTAIADLFTAMYCDTIVAMSRAKGDYVPAGTEVISEVFLNVFDYYQARADAGPYAPFEAAVFRDWVLSGQAERIPLFTYVFGERAPLRMDGWAKLSAESGDLFYWTAANILLNGGLFQLNYEFSPLEDLGELTDDPAEHYYTFDERHYAIDPHKAAFVGELARARVGAANRFLAHGRMLPAPQVAASPVTLPYYAFNMGKGDSIYETRGEMTVPSVLATAWTHEGRVIWLVANLLSQPQEIRIDDKPVSLAGRQILVVEP